MAYGSVCSGIEAPTVAWRPLGWHAAFFAEIDAFPCAVLAHHYPDVPNFGDLTRFKEWPDAAIDVLIGGTPCQSFSIAGLRAGLADPRGNLALTYLAVAQRYRPLWLVWENVPGVLSSGGGDDFAAFLFGLGELGYGWAYRVLDAQHFGVPQRRRRVFVVGSARGWASAAAVLFERESLSGHPAPSRTAGQRPTGTIGASSNSGRSYGSSPIADNLIANCLNAKGGSGRIDAESETFITHTLRAEGFDASEDGTGRGTPLVVPPLTGNAYADHASREGLLIAAPLSAGNNANSNAAGRRREDDINLIAFHARQDPDSGEVTHPLDTDGTSIAALLGAAVRRLTPRECERLQAFPDDYTAIEFRGSPAKDAPRYKALGNSMCTRVIRWLGERIELVESVAQELAA